LVYIKRFMLQCTVQKKHKIHQACRAPISWECVHGVKRSGRDVDYSPQLAPRLKMSGAMPPLPLCLHGVDSDNFICMRENTTRYTVDVPDATLRLGSKSVIGCPQWQSTAYTWVISAYFKPASSWPRNVAGGKRLRLGCNYSTWSEDMVRLFHEQVMEVSRFRSLWQRAKDHGRTSPYKSLLGFF